MDLRAILTYPSREEEEERKGGGGTGTPEVIRGSRKRPRAAFHSRRGRGGGEKGSTHGTMVGQVAFPLFLLILSLLTSSGFEDASSTAIIKPNANSKNHLRGSQSRPEAATPTAIAALHQNGKLKSILWKSLWKVWEHFNVRPSPLYFTDLSAVFTLRPAFSPPWGSRETKISKAPSGGRNRHSHTWLPGNTAGEGGASSSNAPALLQAWE